MPDAPPTNPYPSTGPARGLIGRVRTGDIINAGRALCSYYWSVPKPSGGGTCRWCSQSTASKRLYWHKECARWYLTAKGVTVHAGTSKPLVRIGGGCEECGSDYQIEIDHRISLMVARRLRNAGRRNWWRAWTPANLRPLCHECHRQKTRNDREIMRRLDAGVAPERALQRVSLQRRLF